MGACEFLGIELDAEGHFYYRASLGGDSIAVYPPLDPVSLEHALEVEGTILPKLAEAFVAEREASAFAPFHRFLALWLRMLDGEPGLGGDLDAAETRLVEIVRESVNDHTPRDALEARAFVRWYQHVACESDAYRAKVRASLEDLGARIRRAADADEENG
jgi:hypothetical protein